MSQQPVGIINYASSVTFTGSYTLKLLSVTIKWQKLTGSDFIDINITRDKYTGSSVTGPSPKLVVNSVQFIDETSYGLVVSNGVGYTQSSFITLSVIGGMCNNFTCMERSQQWYSLCSIASSLNIREVVDHSM